MPARHIVAIGGSDAGISAALAADRGWTPVTTVRSGAPTIGLNEEASQCASSFYPAPAVPTR